MVINHLLNGMLLQVMTPIVRLSKFPNCFRFHFPRWLESIWKYIFFNFIYISCAHVFFKYGNHLNSLKFWRLKINVVWHSQDYIANSSFICRKLDLVQVQSWGNPDLVSHGSLGSRQTERRTSVAQHGVSLNQLKTYAVIMGKTVQVKILAFSWPFLSFIEPLE